MQWTDESGRAYGEDPYGGAGSAYAFGDGYSGSATTDTAAMPWAPGQLAQETHPTSDAHAGTDSRASWPHLYVVATDPYAAGPDPATTLGEFPHGDVLTVPPVERDPSDPLTPGPDTAQSESVRPVFVDSSGRRQRRVRRAARLLVIPAAGYVALLISAVLGGPSLSAPFVPQPDTPHPSTPHTSAPDASPGTGHSAGSSTAAQKNSTPTAAQTTSGSTDRSTASATSAATPVPTSATGIASPTSTPTAAPTATPNPTSRGRALGTSHKPVK
ncbi:hypothetical protein [Streptomyces sp. NPDC002265]|uniref:hypothetical protein n=1 Tax=Streptomyces sp. NPDC002265 TaxID=3154415 RepID=UPI00331798A3